MTEQQFIDRLRYIFAQYFEDDEKMWSYVYDTCMTEFYKNRVHKLNNKMRWKKHGTNGSSDGKIQERKAADAWRKEDH